MDNIINELIKILVPLLGAALTAAVGYLAKYFKNKAQHVQNQAAQSALLMALTEAEAVVKEAVLATQQVLVDDLKNQSADGKLTDQERQAAINQAKAYFVAKISKGSLDVLVDAIGALDTWLVGYIEAQIAAQKIGQVATASNPQ